MSQYISTHNYLLVYTFGGCIKWTSSCILLLIFISHLNWTWATLQTADWFIALFKKFLQRFRTKSIFSSWFSRSSFSLVLLIESSVVELPSSGCWRPVIRFAIFLPQIDLIKTIITCYKFSKHLKKFFFFSKFSKALFELSFLVANSFFSCINLSITHKISDHLRIVFSRLVRTLYWISILTCS